MHKAFYILAWLTISIAILGTILIVFWLSYPYTPIKFKKGLLPVLTKKVVAGNDITFISDYCKYYNLPATLSRKFENDLIYALPTIYTNNKTGCHSLKINMLVPKELPGGDYHINIRYIYKVNPIREITVETDTTTFTVINDDIK